MSEIASARIKSFAPVAQQTEVSPEEPIFVLTSSQLQDIIMRAIQAVTEPLKVQIQELKSNQDLQSENQFIQLRLINDLRKGRELQPLQKDRGEILRALIAANDGKMLAKEARQKMHLSRSRFSELLAKTKDDIEVKPYHLKRNQKVLVLK
ncbi:Uncharacterised protein [uncultured archaeon]|nr:Uncharacterised protein [uncultured archaeon]